MNTRNYHLPNGEKVGIFFSEGNMKYIAYKSIGPIKCHLYAADTEEELEKILEEEYHGFEDRQNPAFVRNMFEKWLENKYPFDVAKSAILEWEDLDHKEKCDIKNDIMGYVRDMRKIFHNPHIDDTYYPFGVEVTLQQLADFENSGKKTN